LRKATSKWAQLFTRAITISPEEATFARRGFRGNNFFARQILERVGATFLSGYQTAIEESNQQELEKRLYAVDLDARGFAFEGAAMGLALLDRLIPKQISRLDCFLCGPGAPHVYMVHVGVGWALARLPWTRLSLERSLRGRHPLLKWLAVDGYGFHEGYFNFRKYVDKQVIPNDLSAQALRIFDQGLGRSLWFVEGADVYAIAKTIRNFSTARHADLWSGVGLACAYAGGADDSAVNALRKLGEPYSLWLAQGAAFAAKARRCAGNPSYSTDLACNLLCETSAAEAAGLTDEALDFLNPEGNESEYEAWQRRIRTMFGHRIEREKRSCRL
jgi:hypothetical protein